MESNQTYISETNYIILYTVILWNKIVCIVVEIYGKWLLGARFCLLIIKSTTVHRNFVYGRQHGCSSEKVAWKPFRFQIVLTYIQREETQNGKKTLAAC